MTEGDQGDDVYLLCVMWRGWRKYVAVISAWTHALESKADGVKSCCQERNKKGELREI